MMNAKGPSAWDCFLLYLIAKNSETPQSATRLFTKNAPRWSVDIATERHEMLTCPQALRLALRRMTDTHSRSRRSEFWWIMLIVVVLFIALYVARRFLFLSHHAVISYHPIAFAVIWWLTLPLQLRRMHDSSQKTFCAWVLAFLWIGKAVLNTWWFDLMREWGGSYNTVNVVVNILFYLLLVLCISIWCIDSYPGDNKWGPSPKYEGPALLHEEIR